jgi:hypothetical protein
MRQSLHTSTYRNGADHRVRIDSTIPRKGRPNMPGFRLTREVLCSHAKPVGPLKRGKKRYLRGCLIVDSTSDDSAFSKWMLHRFGERDIGLHIDEQRGLGRRRDLHYERKSLSAERGSETTTTDTHQQLDLSESTTYCSFSNSPRAINKG